MSEIKTASDLFEALKKIHSLATAENEARKARGEEWLRDFGQCGFSVWGEFWETEHREGFTIKHGSIEEYALTHFVAVTVEGYEDETITVTPYSGQTFAKAVPEVQDILGVMEARKGSGDGEIIEIVTPRYSSMKTHYEKARKLADFLISNATLVDGKYQQSGGYDTELGQWYLEEPPEIIKLLKNPHPKLPGKAGCKIGFWEGLDPLGQIAISGERIKKVSGEFAAVLDRLDKTEI
ncbi:MAG: hypothetical protein IH626_20990 [Rhodospirillales bacterium]|nr:hypothetical protein [Rhodospirillales bacterium]